MPDPFANPADEILAQKALGAPPLPPDLHAFEELVRRYQVPLRHFLGQRFPSRHDTDDILQTTFLKAWQSLRLYNPSLPFRTWIYTIAYRTAVSEGRRDRPAKPLSPALSSPGPAPHHHAQQEDDRRSLWRQAREVLSDEQFTALWLHYVDELPARDIARVLNRSWVSVKTIMHRARKKLEPCLAEFAPPRAPPDHFVPQPVPAALKAGDA